MSILLAPTWQVFAMGLLRVGLGHREAAGRVAALGKQPTVGGGGTDSGKGHRGCPSPGGLGFVHHMLAAEKMPGQVAGQQACSLPPRSCPSSGRRLPP